MSQPFEPLPLSSHVDIDSREVALEALPEGVSVLEPVGLAGVASLQGQVVFRSDSLFETRATRTPGGNFLLMFPANTLDRPTGLCHYGRPQEKVNDLVALRSSDQGATWGPPTRPIDIDYNLHGFIPLTPRDSSRIYNFGTQPIWGMQEQGPGLHENAPIGYRYSDDDGHHWSEVRLIRPTNYPAFQGMSVMRMCETDRGTWLLGSHEGDWSYRPLMTRQYLLRSTDQGASWEVAPDPRHGGWYVRGFNRMDEGRPINLGNDHVLLMTRTPEGHLWQAWSEDDGESWTDPTPSTLVHPDAPPMLFALGDGRLIALHHNRHHDIDYDGLITTKEVLTRDRGEVWFATSTDGGVHWSQPRFLFTTAAARDRDTPFDNFQCSYIDAFADDDTLHLFLAHRWQQVLHLRIAETALDNLPTGADLRG